MTDKDKILEKIKKILALSSSSNEAEAALALEKAQNLMARYDLSERDILLSSRWKNDLAAIIGNAFGCEVIPCGPRDQYLLFIGIRQQEDVAEYVFDVLYQQGKIARATFIKTKLKHCSRIIKIVRANSFCEGWVQGLRSKVRDFAGTEGEEDLIHAYLTVSDPQNTQHSDYWNGNDEAKNVPLHHVMNDGQGQDVRMLT